MQKQFLALVCAIISILPFASSGEPFFVVPLSEEPNAIQFAARWMEPECLEGGNGTKWGMWFPFGSSEAVSAVVETFHDGDVPHNRSSVSFGLASRCFWVAGDAYRALKFAEWAMRLEPDNEMVRQWFVRCAVSCFTEWNEQCRLLLHESYERNKDIETAWNLFWLDCNDRNWEDAMRWAKVLVSDMPKLPKCAPALLLWYGRESKSMSDVGLTISQMRSLLDANFFEKYDDSERFVIGCLLESIRNSLPETDNELTSACLALQTVCKTVSRLDDSNGEKGTVIFDLVPDKILVTASGTLPLGMEGAEKNATMVFPDWPTANSVEQEPGKSIVFSHDFVMHPITEKELGFPSGDESIVSAYVSMFEKGSEKLAFEGRLLAAECYFWNSENIKGVALLEKLHEERPDDERVARELIDRLLLDKFDLKRALSVSTNSWNKTGKGNVRFLETAIWAAAALANWDAMSPLVAAFLSIPATSELEGCLGPVLTYALEAEDKTNGSQVAYDAIKKYCDGNRFSYCGSLVFETSLGHAVYAKFWPKALPDSESAFWEEHNLVFEWNFKLSSKKKEEEASD